MDKVQFYLCDKKKDCNKSPSCILGSSYVEKFFDAYERSKKNKEGQIDE